MSGASIVTRAIARTGSMTSVVSACAMPWASKLSRFHFSANSPEVIEPPETLETRSSFLRNPSSFKRQSEPRWKSIAR